MVCTNTVHGHRRQLLKCPFSDLCVFTVLILSKISRYCKHNSVNETRHKYRHFLLTLCPLVMQLLHFTQIALYAFLMIYLLGKLWVVDKLFCSHNEIRSKEAGPHFIYLIFYGLYSVIVQFLFFSLRLM